MFNKLDRLDKSKFFWVIFRFDIFPTEAAREQRQ